MEPMKTLDFSEALKIVKNGGTVSRTAWGRAGDVIITMKAQYPDEHSKMTKPYLYMEKEYTDATPVHERFPLDLSAESIFAEDWYEIPDEVFASTGHNEPNDEGSM